MKTDAELIAEHLAKKGVTKCPDADRRYVPNNAVREYLAIMFGNSQNGKGRNARYKATNITRSREKSMADTVDFKNFIEEKNEDPNA